MGTWTTSSLTPRLVSNNAGHPLISHIKQEAYTQHRDPRTECVCVCMCVRANDKLSAKSAYFLIGKIFRVQFIFSDEKKILPQVLRVSGGVWRFVNDLNVLQLGGAQCQCNRDFGVYLCVCVWVCECVPGMGDTYLEYNHCMNINTLRGWILCQGTLRDCVCGFISASEIVWARTPRDVCNCCGYDNRHTHTYTHSPNTPNGLCVLIFGLFATLSCCCRCDILWDLVGASISRVERACIMIERHFIIIHWIFGSV